MVSLKKLLAPRFLRSFFLDALEGLDERVYACVVAEDEVVAWVGGLADDFASTPDNLPEPRASLPLSLDDCHVGDLVVGAVEPFAEADMLIRAASHMLSTSLRALLGKEYVRRALGEETLEQYRELALMQRAVSGLNASMKLGDVASSLLHECEQGTGQAACGAVYLHNESDGSYTCLDTFGPYTQELMEQVPRNRLFNDIMHDGKGQLLNDVHADPRWDAGPMDTTGLIILPLIASGVLLGALVLMSSPDGNTFHAAHLKRASTLASAASTALANALHFEQVQRILTALMQSLSTAIDSRDTLTAGHSQRVALYALGLARIVSEDTVYCPDLCFSDKDLQEIYFAGLLHDVGKIGVREEVLTKASRLPGQHVELIGLRLAMWGQNGSNGERESWKRDFSRLQGINRAYDLTTSDLDLIDRLAETRFQAAGSEVTLLSDDERERLLTPKGNLTAEEWNEIRRHPKESYRILKNIPFSEHYPQLLNIIVQHHERLDGSGYPYGLGKTKILPQSRIMAIVDVYDSLRRDRHYKKALSQEMAIKILRDEARRGKLDSDIVNLFCEHVDSLEATFPVARASVSRPALHF